MANREKELANEIGNKLNSMSFSNKVFCEFFSREHRTLQQSFTSLCIDWLKYCASDDYPRDERNEAAHIVAKEMLGAFEKEHGVLPNRLPFI